MAVDHVSENQQYLYWGERVGSDGLIGNCTESKSFSGCKGYKICQNECVYPNEQM